MIDPKVLNSLPQREYLAGLAEVIKYGLIYDEGFFSWIESNSKALISGESSKIGDAIARSCEIKSEASDLISQDLAIASPILELSPEINALELDSIHEKKPSS